ncbi:MULTISPECIES: sensor domain-containing diguanylate cyclase [unclassified Butyrivibrio]|uniref:sensor domain-containing diguanylate cyclase n=1 Tax=unclassified Butyrivibrio TaxID=2639466 RepID=UPI0003B4A893|nr:MULTISPECIES: EAL domain-containing protein [unclassified Butyrivibrio]
MEKYRYDSTTFKILESTSVPFAVYQYINKRLVTILLSQGFLDFYGYENKQDTYDLMDNDMFRDIHPDDVAFIADASHRFLEDDDPYDVIYRSKIHGEYRIIHSYGRHIYKEDGTRLEMCWYTDHGPFVESSEFKEDGSIASALSIAIMDRSANRTLSYDYLTGFPSMTNYFELANEGCRVMRESGRTPVILFLDFNGMKSYNQKYGMEEGDRFLVAFSRILIDHFSSNNCSRFSADHFCVYTDSEGVEDVCQTIIEQSKNINGGKTMPLRVGVYYYDSDDVTISAACDRAKLACDSDKKTYDAHIYYFDKAMIAALDKQRYIVENLDRALEEEWIQVYHQPIFRAANDHICNEEALARWIDPEKGLISPQDFVPVLEEANSVYKLDLYMVDKVLEKMQGQMAHGVYVVPESVNFSRSDFYTCDLVEEIRSRVDKSGLGRDKLIIEITESALADDIDYMTVQIKRFKELGFTVWMDDYGSGYSSPVILLKIPFDLIKLDMLFVSQIDESRSGRIIVTEIVRMAMALGLETIAEGVETEKQAEFLKEIGCTKLQGFLFAKPLSLDEIFEKRETISAEMFENPAETDYYAQIGNVNLYDLSISKSDDDKLLNYFDTMPMVLVEVGEKTLSICRCNESFKKFLDKSFPGRLERRKFNVGKYENIPGNYTLNAIVQCAIEGRRTFIDDITEDGRSIQLFMRRVAVNPITGDSAVAIVILSISDGSKADTGLTYNYIARALSEDYVNMYFVKMDTGDFIEYAPDGYNSEITVERHGNNFFEECKKDAQKQLYKDDIDEFFNVFNKEYIEKSLKENGTFTHTYRLMRDGEPVYVNMKIVAIRNRKNEIIIGVNNVDAQMKQKEAIEKLREESLIYSRISALSGDYMAIYIIDPATDEYALYSSKEFYATLGTPEQGPDFFNKAVKAGEKVIFKDDYALFSSRLNKENVLRHIEEDGIFTLNYRLMIDKKPVYVQIRANLIHENSEDRIIMGILNVDRETRKEQEYNFNLMAAREEANIDELTGVKNKHAYLDMEEVINNQINEGACPEFAIAVFDLNNLKAINDTKGHQAGDRYIKDGCKIICKTFTHSPVFRLGGDEFAVIVDGEDYDNLEANMEKIAKINQKNMTTGKVVIAAGASRFARDKNVAAVFKRADKSMYENKAELKS